VIPEVTIDRLVVAGSVIVDLVMFVPALPVRGGDVLADDATLTTGGGYNVLTAAARQGLRAAYAGRHGTGPFGDRVRADLAAAGVEPLLPPAADGDTGFCVGLVEADGERTYATRQGVEGTLTSADLDGAGVRATDAVYLSGYDVAYAHGAVVSRWFANLPAEVLTVFDPGPLAGELPTGPLDLVLGRPGWVSANRREAGLLTGRDDPAAAAVALAAGRDPDRGGAVVRSGADGCWVAGGTRGPDEVTHVPVPIRVTAVDTGGAGDAHVGAFAAALARGEPPASACRWANAAAARCVATRGPATAPTYDVTLADLR
jgi:sugar/nucleoside kinase (ribokinase family)